MSYRMHPLRDSGQRQRHIKTRVAEVSLAVSIYIHTEWHAEKLKTLWNLYQLKSIAYHVWALVWGRPLLVLAGPHTNYSRPFLGMASSHGTILWSLFYTNLCITMLCAIPHCCHAIWHVARWKLILEYYRKIKFRQSEENSVLKSQNHFL